MRNLRASIIVPALNEALTISNFLERLEESVLLPVEVLIVVDTETDLTLPAILSYSPKRHAIRGVVRISEGTG